MHCLRRNVVQKLYVSFVTTLFVSEVMAQPPTFNLNNVTQLLDLNTLFPQNIPLPNPVTNVVNNNVPFAEILLDAFISESPTQTSFPSPSSIPSPIPSPSSSWLSSTSPSSSIFFSPSSPSLQPQAPSRTPSMSPLTSQSPSFSQPPSNPSSPSVEASVSPTPLMNPTPLLVPSTISQSSSMSSSPSSTMPSISSQPQLTSSPVTSASSSPTASHSVSPSQTPSPSPSISSPCLSGCRCESPGELLGESSFDEAELQKFADGQSYVFYASDFPSGPVFRSNWDENLVAWDGSKLTISVEKRGDGSLYGGIISSLFTYTGNFDGIGGSTPNHNEIDIEFEGQDTTKVQFNYYSDDDFSVVQRNELDYELGFDASQSFNVYGFRWTPWGIEWEVNGVIARQVSYDNENTTPIVTSTTVQKVMANAWIVPVSSEPFFGGTFDVNAFTTASAEYKWIRYEKLDQYGCCSISESC